MVSFFSHGFASGGSSAKKEKKEKEGDWVPVVDGLGRTINWQHRTTGFYYMPFNPAPMVGGAFVVPQVQPMAQQAFQPAMPWGMNVVPVMPPIKKKKDKENEAEYWDSLRDENGVRYYKNSRTKKTTYFDPYR